MGVNQNAKANTLRKEGNYEEAILIYEENWTLKKDKFTGAGLLHCLRKIKSYERALLLSEELEEQYLDFNWAKNEVIWTNIEAHLLQIEDKEKINELVAVANKIIDFNPEQIALEKVVFRVMKIAKQANRWDVINEWMEKLDPNFLSNEPIRTPKGSIGWSKLSLWHNYKANALLKKGKCQAALETLNDIIGKTPKQQERLFQRLKAVTYYQLGDIERAEEIYKELCADNRTDWWLIHEYAKTKRDLGDLNQALKLMYRAVSKGRKLENMVSLISDIGFVCMELNRKEEAYHHLFLAKKIREKNDWNINSKLVGNLKGLSDVIDEPMDSMPFKKVLKVCEGYWFPKGSQDDIKKRKKRLALEGSILLGKKEAPFCFIKSGEESFFCLKADIKHKSELKEGMYVRFDAIPSFDRKKNMESWKAINVQER